MKRIAILALSVLLLCACSATGTMDPYYGGYSNVSTTRNGRVNGTNDGYYRGQYGYNGMYGQTGYANGYAQGGYAGSSYPNGYSQNGYTNGSAASGYTGSANSTTGMSTTTTTGRAATTR